MHDAISKACSTLVWSNGEHICALQWQIVNKSKRHFWGGAKQQIHLKDYHMSTFKNWHRIYATIACFTNGLDLTWEASLRVAFEHIADAKIPWWQHLPSLPPSEYPDPWTFRLSADKWALNLHPIVTGNLLERRKIMEYKFLKVHPVLGEIVFLLLIRPCETFDISVPLLWQFPRVSWWEDFISSNYVEPSTLGLPLIVKWKRLSKGKAE